MFAGPTELEDRDCTDANKAIAGCEFAIALNLGFTRNAYLSMLVTLSHDKTPDSKPN